MDAMPDDAPDDAGSPTELTADLDVPGLDVPESDVPAAAPLTPRLLRDRSIALLPGIMAGSPIAAIEVLVQEGIGVLSLPVGRIDELATLRGVFARRAEFAVHHIDTVRQVDEAVAAGAGTLLLRHAAPDLVRAAVARRVPVLAPALTPTEVRQVWNLGVSAVLLTPADAFGGQYAEQLVTLVPDAVVVPAGGIGAYSGGRWLEAGSPAVCLDDALVGDAFSGGSLAQLRERAQTFRDAVARH